MNEPDQPAPAAAAEGAPAKEPESKPEPEAVTPSAIVDGEMPPPSQHVIEKFVDPGAAKPPPEKEPTPDPAPKPPPKPAQSQPEPEKRWTDPSGKIFRPERHQHREGKPETTPGGYVKPWTKKQKKAGLHHRPEGLGPQSAPEPERKTEPEQPAKEPEPEKREGFLDKAKKLFGGGSDREEPRLSPAPDPPPAAESGATPPPESGFRNGGFIGQPPPSGQPPATKPNEASQAAEQFVAMEEMLAVMLFSEEWQFLSEERKGLIAAWTRAFEVKGVVETPWWMELGAAHAVIVANRADKPKTRQKLGRMKAALQKRILDMRSARAPKREKQSEPTETEE